MRLDHISYVTTHEQLADTVQRLGSRLGTTFIDGGIHPRFGTRNFTAALLNGRYIEVVCPLDHPATESTPWGVAVSKKAKEGGGWFSWVFSTPDILDIANKFGRKATEGHRTRPNGMELKWSQIGVKEISDSPHLPFFIEWKSEDHPSSDGLASADISEIVIADENQLRGSWFREEIIVALGDVAIKWDQRQDVDGGEGIISVLFKTINGEVLID